MICPHCEQKGYQAEIISVGSLNRCIRCVRDVRREVSRTPIKLEQKGKVLICTVHGRTNVPGADRLVLAVGKPKGQTYFQWWEWVPALAPSRDLVTYTKEHNRKGRLPGWFERYTEHLLDEWYSSKEFLNEFSSLVEDLKLGKVIAVSCYCDHRKREFCHLSVLADLIRDLGYQVEEAEPIHYVK